MSIQRSDIEDLIEAAVAAESWFTQRECINPLSLDYSAYQIADKLRGILKRIEEVEPETLRQAEQFAPLLLNGRIQ